MPYVYEEHRPFVLTDEGQRKLLNVLSCARKAIDFGGAVMAGKLLIAAGTGDQWDCMAVVDRLVELGYLSHVTEGFANAWQHRVFVEGRQLP